MTTVAIIGAGPLGRWLALRAGQAGFRVLLEDVLPNNLEHAQESIRQHLGPDAMPEIEFVSTIEDAVRPADLVIDCVPDELESKLEILWLLDRMAPPAAVLATPTTHLSIADLAACTYRPQQVIAIHANPMTMVEGGFQTMQLQTTAQTAQASLALVQEFWRRLGIESLTEVEPYPAR
jgi:3-hydroxybutyryl-CoA dehydrogenase